MDNQFIVRTAKRSDRNSIDSFLKEAAAIHRHLDWRSPLDWLGNRYFLLAENEEKITALLICTAEPNEVFWLRVFASKDFLTIPVHFQELFNYFIDKVSDAQIIPEIAVIAYYDWMRALMDQNKWKIHQLVVQLHWKETNLRKLDKKWPEDLVIRPMKLSDVDITNVIDHECFNNIWKQSKDVNRRAFDQAAYATVAELNNEVVGFQTSTSYKSIAHLARLAVTPKFQGQHIGQALVHNMLKHFQRPWIQEITVNTQKDNTVSLNLYRKMGFKPSGDQYPIYLYSQNH
jgi:ribosomal-protein-alanine N-acetyltransferase